MTIATALPWSDNLLSITAMLVNTITSYIDLALRVSRSRGLAVALVFFSAATFNVFSQSTPGNRPVPHNPVTPNQVIPDTIPVASPLADGDEVAVTHFDFDDGVFTEIASDTLAVVAAPDDEWERREVAFFPDPNRAVWMSALCPGLGQIYNRRFWKLPLVIGGYLGLGYATNWNNSMLKDYTRAYADLNDNDPTTRSYMDFFHGNVKEEDLDKTWLNNILKSRKDYFRRNRDLCVICMVGVYLLAMVDAYVDASLSHFDISPQLSMDVTPALIQDSRGRLPGVGLQWALCF